MSAAAPAPRPSGPRSVRELPAGNGFPLHVHPEWREQYPWLAQGISSRADGDPFDMSFFGDTPAGVMVARWAELRAVLGIPFAVHARQVHGARVLRHERTSEGVHLADAADGHATAHAGVLMAVTVADCVPVSIIDPRGHGAALLHAGWRGVAANILEAGLAALCGLTRRTAASFRVHLGPAICGACYEVGPEVAAALGLSGSQGTQTVDLRALLAARAVAAGVPWDHISASAHCTRCGDGGFHSHRGGDRARQVAVLGIRGAAA